MLMCVDYSDLKAQTEKDSFPLPRIDQVRSTLSRPRYIATVDLLMEYHQVEMDTKDRAKTAFLTHRGLYVQNVMPFGLCIAPANFKRLMEKILGAHIYHGVLVYLDDVLIYAEAPEQLLENLVQVLRLLNQAGLIAWRRIALSLTLSLLSGTCSLEGGINSEFAKLKMIKQ